MKTCLIDPLVHLLAHMLGSRRRHVRGSQPSTSKVTNHGIPDDEDLRRVLQITHVRFLTERTLLLCLYDYSPEKVAIKVNYRYPEKTLVLPSWSPFSREARINEHIRARLRTT